MQGKWQIAIDDNTLILRDIDNNYIIPTAKEIFLTQFKNINKIRNMTVVKPSEELELTFSKYPIEIKIVLAAKTDKENIYIAAHTVVDIKGQQVKVIGQLDSNVDHIIIESTWYPFVKGSIHEIKQILQDTGIGKLGRISLQQYIFIKKLENELVIDMVNEIPIDKGPYISNTDIELPTFKGKLFPYQNQGFRWLKMIVNENAGCILADEMGLGKTAQIIAVLAYQSLTANNPSLVVAPVSLLENWRREVDKFAPSLAVLVHQGNNRTGFYREFKKYNLVITSYETILRDLSLFQMLRWNIVIADEAQTIKNPLAKRTQAMKQLDRYSTIAVTGTPIENRLVDLWSLSDFVFPGYLGDIKSYQDMFPDDVVSAERLEPLISPILLRRRVRDVADDLPKRIDIPQVLKLSLEEAQQYDTFRMQIIDEYGERATLVSLIKLRMFCTHPLLQFPSKTREPTDFSKYMRLVEIIEEIISNKEKVIIFTSFKDMVDLLVIDLSKRFDIYCDFIDGRVDVSNRQTKIDNFSDVKESAILVLNPRAAGTGLNITAANHVIHYNLEWNPAVEDQASARAHRRGQMRPVTIYRLFCADTVEEAINERLERKREISDAAVIGTDGSKSDNTDILHALLRSPLT
jgi:SNF2 family DNA or RNA helicase